MQSFQSVITVRTVYNGEPVSNDRPRLTFYCKNGVRLADRVGIEQLSCTAVGKCGWGLDPRAIGAPSVPCPEKSLIEWRKRRLFPPNDTIWSVVLAPHGSGGQKRNGKSAEWESASYRLCLVVKWSLRAIIITCSSFNEF